MPPTVDRECGDLRLRLAAILGRRVVSLTPLTGGMIAQVVAVTLADGETVVVKHDPSGTGRLDVEGTMLRHLREHSALPVPVVQYADPTLLVIEHLPGKPATAAAEPHLAELLAALHAIQANRFGFGQDTLSGTLLLPSPWTGSWVAFFRDRRLRHAAHAALGNGTLPPELHTRIGRTAERLENLLHEPAAPSLIHGDVWRNNVLAVGPRVTGLIDPSICYADPEQELAYMALNDGFTSRFFDAYGAARPIDPEFWRLRRYVYQLYPLLLHVYFFGASDLPPLDEALRRLDG
jgi:fructosamine-3-kinase